MGCLSRSGNYPIDYHRTRIFPYVEGTYCHCSVRADPARLNDCLTRKRRSPSGLTGRDNTLQNRNNDSCWRASGIPVGWSTSHITTSKIPKRYGGSCSKMSAWMMPRACPSRDGFWSHEVSMRGPTVYDRLCETCRFHGARTCKLYRYSSFKS